MSAGARSWRAGVSGIAAALGIGLLMALCLGLGTRSPSDTGAAVPLDDDRVVARLHPNGRSYPEAVRDLLGAVRADPDNAGASRRAALALIDEGRRAGDTRLVGAALGLVRPFLDAGDAEAMVIAATARQYQHDFEGALVLLDAALARAPNDAGALLMRATIKTVEGNLTPAREDCRRIGTLLRVDLLMIGLSTVLDSRGVESTSDAFVIR